MLFDGTRVRLDSARRPLTAVRYFHITSPGIGPVPGSGYVVLPRLRPSGAMVHTLSTVAQTSAPQPGRTLGIELSYKKAFSSLMFKARLAPAQSAADVALVAADIGG